MYIKDYTNKSNISRVNVKSHGESKMVTVSIIVPVYNVGKYISKCLDSILSQDFTDYELILVNDGSEDNSLDICNSYLKKDSRIVVISQENQGVSSARNRGLDIARGIYVVFIDSDDYVEDNYLSTLISIIIENKVDVGICSYSKVFQAGVKNEMLIGKNMYLNQESMLIYLFLPNYYRGYLVNKILKRTIIEKNRIRFSDGLSVQEDLWFIYQYMLQAQSAFYLDCAVYNYVQRDNSALRFLDSDNYLSKHLNLHRNIEIVNHLVLSTIPPEYKNVIRAVKHSKLTADISFCVGCISHGFQPDNLFYFVKQIRRGLLKYLIDHRFPIKNKVYGCCIGINWRLALWVYRLNRKIKC